LDKKNQHVFKDKEVFQIWTTSVTLHDCYRRSCNTRNIWKKFHTKYTLDTTVQTVVRKQISTENTSV